MAHELHTQRTHRRRRGEVVPGKKFTQFISFVAQTSNFNVLNLSILPRQYAACVRSDRASTSSTRPWIPFLQSIYLIDCSILNRSPETESKQKGETHRPLDKQNSWNSISREIDCIQSKSAWDNVIERTQLNQSISLSCRHGHRRWW